MEKQLPLVEHDAPYVNMTADREHGILIIQWKNYAPSGTYRATLDMAVEWIQRYHLRAFLTDQRRRGAILHDDEVWLATSWAPRMAKAGLERAAIVQSPDFFNHMVIDRIVQTVLPTVPYPIMNFMTLAEAQAWLMSDQEVLA